MRLLFAIKSLNVQGGGAERVLTDVANGLRQRGHDVSVMTFDPPGQEFYSLDPRIERIDLAFNEPGTPTSKTAFFATIPLIRAAVKRQRADVVVPFMHSAYVPIALATLGLRKKLIFSEHTDVSHYKGRPFQRLLLETMRPSARATTIPSEGARYSYSKMVMRSMTVIFNPIELSRFASPTSTADTETPQVLAVGRLMEQKDHLCLLRAFASLLREFPQWRLRIVGDGVLRELLEAEIARLGLGGSAALAGFSDDVARDYQRSSFVAISSRYESFGLVAAEALASRRLVIAFDTCVGISEFVRDGVNGLLVPGAGSDEARAASLADGMRRLMADEELRRRLGAAGPEAVSRFGLDTVLDQWEALLAEVAARG